MVGLCGKRIKHRRTHSIQIYDKINSKMIRNKAIEMGEVVIDILKRLSESITEIINEIQ